MFKVGRKTLIIGISSLLIIIITTSLIVVLRPETSDGGWSGEGFIADTAATLNIQYEIENDFSTFIPLNLNYTPSISPKKIKSDLSNVDTQDLYVYSNIKEQLSQYGFAIADEGYKNIYDVYDNEYDGYEIPKFVTTDLCLHTYHVLYDTSLRLLEMQRFVEYFETMLYALRDAQIALNTTVTESSVHDALNKNIAYLSVMLYLISETNTIPTEVVTLTQAELDLINATVRTPSAIFDYFEDYTQYIVRGHYTRTEILANYFKAMMYAGRMVFSTVPIDDYPELDIEQTRMAMLLISSFNSTIGSETVWDYWDKLYEPTKFYVGASDDLTPKEYYEVWENFYYPSGDDLSSSSLISTMIESISTLRNPLINSMGTQGNLPGFKLMGQRFVPDSYIFQKLVDTEVSGRKFPTGLDVFSVFGSPRSDYYMQNENDDYPDYDNQISELRYEFRSLNESEWVQNLYWTWLYVLFPLLSDSFDGYPGFMQSSRWADKALMTTLGSWAELRHDTILYAKQSYTIPGVIWPDIHHGYVEPYPHVYSRLASLTRMMYDGLESRGLLLDDFESKLYWAAFHFEKLAEISVKELENKSIDSDLDYIDGVGGSLLEITTFDSEDPDSNEEEDRTAVIADVHTCDDKVLEVGVGDPYTIYVVVQDHEGNLYLTRGATFSYYEFEHPSGDRLTDEAWYSMLDTNPPSPPQWIQTGLNIHTSVKFEISVIVNKLEQPLSFSRSLLVSWKYTLLLHS